MWVMWYLISIHLFTVLVSVQNWCAVCAKRTIGSEIVLDAPMELLGDVYHVVTWFMWNLILVCLETVLVSEQDRCTVCDKHPYA